MSKPNVLFIMTDQQRWDSLGCYGNSVIETANLDWLASEGVVFENAYSSCPSCVPARASIMTGMHPWNTGILGMGNGQGPMGGGFQHTLPGELSKAAYHTQGVGKMHFHPQRLLNGFHSTFLDESGREESPGFISDYRQWFNRNKTGDFDIVDHGIDWNSWMARPYHAPEFLHPTNWTVNQSIEALKRRDPSKPFFLMTSFARPHSPYDALPYYFDLYQKKQVPEPYVGDWASIHDVEEDAAKPDAWRGVRSKGEIRRARAGYYGSIHHIDHQIGRLLLYLQKIQQLENTLIIFTSDHGDMLGDHNLWRKTYAYEGSAHIPMIVRLPESLGKPSYKRIDAPVLLQDIMPTILEATGTEIPETVDGISMLGLIRGEQTERSYIHGEHCTCYSEEQEMQYLTDGRMKYIWLPRVGIEQLFDLTEGRDETINLAKKKEYSHELQKWRARLVAELSPRNAGLTDGDQLVNQSGKPYLTSPKYKERLDAWEREFKK
ncbi:arylsulfatase [Paenibacillus filicis]|uniref:Arylsulfatase n=1 Tax=Paenibacillus gyeongsangnamensis TaxID=3388067 RepID=A0ABT4QGN6_9BACL|nr:arylsulfatase [Paenibacillus filicis]MCZ8516048.1 arylsulfatase [Paenibacillus filicis]